MTRPLRPTDPRELGAYQLVGRLGEGGMGTVFLARDPAGRLVAVKVIRPEYAGEDEFRARFRSEVNRARQVPPFCTAEVLDADPDHRTPYLVVEYVDGPSLADVIEEQGPLAAGNLHSVAVGVATALAAIHGAGVIHRDLKPRNVLFSLGTPKVIDFGIARALEATSQHTRTDQMVGTVAYMAPERFETDAARTVSPAADVFAWGAVVAYAGTGRTPFQGDSAAATAARILTQPPDLTNLAEPLRGLVERALAKQPDDRPTAHELLDLLLAAGVQDTAALDKRPELRRAAEAMSRFPIGTTKRSGLLAAPRRRRLGWAAASAAVVLAGVLLLNSASAQRVLAAFGAGEQAGRDALDSTAPVVTRSPARIVAGPTVIDRLDRPGQWSPSRDDGGSCAFENQLVVTTSSSNVYQCRGPADIFSGDQSIDVDATVLTANACAYVWFRVVGTSGYGVSMCPDRLGFGLVNDGDYDLATFTTSAVAKPGEKHHLTIDIRNDRAFIAVDGRQAAALALDEPSLRAGKVVLGAINNDNNGDSRAAFADVEIRSR